MSAFVGRERELGELVAALDDAVRGRGRLVLIGGEPGIGKSRLADELAARAREQGAQVLVGRCWEAGGAPAFWPWIQVLRTRTRGRDGELLHAELGAGAPDVAQIVPELRDLLPGLPEPASLGPEGARFRLFDAVASFLRNTAEAEPLLVVLDDLHAADAPSLLLLRFVARQLGTSRVLILGAYRDVDPTLSEPLAGALTDLAREPATRTLSLRGLDETDVARFIELTTAHAPAVSLVESVYAETEGNPLFVGEIVRLLDAEGRLDGPTTRLAIPETLTEVIGRRLRRLSAECNSALALASALGREFDLEALELMSSLGRDDLQPLLHEPIAERVVTEVPGSPGRMRFAHALIRDTVYEAIPQTRRLELQREAGEVLERLHARELGPHLAEIALHFFEAEDPRAGGYARRAGDRATTLLAYEEAVRLYEIALALEDDQVARCELLLALGDAQARAGDTPSSKDTYRDAADLAERLGLPEHLARAALGYGGRLVWDVSRDDETLVPLLERALAAIGKGDSALRVKLLARLAAGPLRDARFPRERRERLSEEGLEMARRLDDPPTLAYALLGYIEGHLTPDFTPRLLGLAAELVDISLAAGEKERAAEGYEELIEARLELGEPGVEDDLEALTRLAAELHQPAQYWLVAAVRALVELLQGRLTEAEGLIAKARSLGEQAQGWNAEVTHVLQLYVLRREQGRLDEVEGLVRRAAAAHTTYPICRCVLAEMTAALGGRAESAQLLASLVADDLRQVPFDEEWLVSMCFLSETAASLGDRERASLLYQRLLPYADRLAVGYPEVSTGAVSRYLGLLATTLSRWKEAERHFDDALSLNERMGARPWVAHTQHDLARMLAARDEAGDAERAEQLLEAALPVARELGMGSLELKISSLLGTPADDDAFAGYRIEAELGRGGMGVVYRATDLQLERPVALKLIAPELSEDPAFRGRFLTETRLAASLDHPHVLPVHAAGEHEGRLYLAMRYVEGEDLKALLGREGRLEPQRALAICGQVAEALDAAHARGLVHRDVKPANVLLDARGEAYLADFGLTKQVGGESTRTGRIVGTLDYLAPEQVRGEGVDGRTDQYALACVLHECLAGQAPFHRGSEAEVLWAHMQEEPPSLPAYPQLDPVLARGLAKERTERYASCAELVEAAGQALGLETPRLRRRRRRLRRRGLALVAAGVLVLGGAVAAAVVELTGGSSPPTAVGNAVAAIDAGHAQVSSYTATGTTPSNVVVGGGSVWVLNADDRTISRIDPKTRRIVKTFATGGLPTDLAFGDGSLWVGNGFLPKKTGLIGFAYTSSVARVDPDTYLVTDTIPLPRPPVGADVYGSSPISQLTVARGSVWAINPDGSVSRIDAATNRIVARIPVKFATAIAADKESVWVVRNAAVTRIDPRTGRIGQTISVPAAGFAGIAVGDGAVWTTDPNDGTVWRIEPGPSPTTRTISAGFGVTFVTYADGAVWTANFIQGTLSRIDPATNAVTSTVPLPGTPQGIAGGQGMVWATTAGGSREGALPATACGKVESGGRRPDLLVASDLPLQLGSVRVTRSMADAVRFVLRRHGYRAGRFTVGYQSCDDSTAQSGGADYFKCASNAKAYSQAAQLAAVIGPYNSYCAFFEVPIVNRAAGGSVPMLSPANTATGLTRASPGVPRGQPEDNYPTGVRNYLRVVPPDDLQAAADAVFAKQLGLRNVYVLGDQYNSTLSSGFTRAARKLGLRIAGSAHWPAPGGYSSLAGRVARSGADGVFLGGTTFTGGDKVVRELRARLGHRFPIIVTDAFLPVPDLLELAGPAALGTYASFPGLGTLSPHGERLVRSFAATQPGGTIPAGTYVPQTLQAAELVLQAIARSDGTRPSVLRELGTLHGRYGVLGPYRFDANGDVTPEHVTIFRITGHTPKRLNLVSDFQGSVPVKVVSIPTGLLGTTPSRP